MYDGPNLEKVHGRPNGGEGTLGSSELVRIGNARGGRAHFRLASEVDEIDLSKKRYLPRDSPAAQTRILKLDKFIRTVP